MTRSTLRLTRARNGTLRSRRNKKPEPVRVRVFNLAATYSRGSYTATTIGKAAFDGRVRDGIGSVHSFMTTKNSFSPQRRTGRKEGQWNGKLVIENFQFSICRLAFPAA